MLKKNWWKALGVFLLLISLTVGMITPLRPGIVDLSPLRVEAGSEVEFDLLGYNTEFDSGNEPLAWLRLDSEHIVAAKSVQIIDPQRLKVSFTIPDDIPGETQREARISVNDSKNGFITSLKRPYITGGVVNASGAEASWNGEVTAIDKVSGFTFPFLPNIYESVRNTFYHVSLWFAMFFLFILGVIQSIKYLRGFSPEHDMKATGYTSAGTLFGILGLVTGMVWASYTWGKPWSWDIKQTMTAILLLIYSAYFVLRISFEDEEQRAKISAVYNIFAFISIIPLLYVIPRLVDSLHPGGEGNPAFGTNDLDMNVRVIFYLSVIGWCIIGYWMASLNYRAQKVDAQLLEKEIG